MLVDDFGRHVTSLRIQVNTTCNFKCFFCHMEGTGIQKREMSFDEILSVIRVAHKQGINKIKFTGGEPTLRRDIVDLVRATRSIVSGEISMTTNGTRLRQLAPELKEAGLDRINVSMHSIDREGFEFITGVDAFDKAVDGVHAAQEAGLLPVKVNFVALNGINADNIWDMINASASEDFILQIIEYEVPRELENSEDYTKYHYSLESLEQELAGMAVNVDHNSLHDRPLFHLQLPTGSARVEIVRPMRNYHFCDNCTRMRLTSLGELKPCLMRNDNYTRALKLGDASVSEESIEEAFQIATKKREPYWKREDSIESQILCEVQGTGGD